jgi:hypothetical protein
MMWLDLLHGVLATDGLRWSRAKLILESRQQQQALVLRVNSCHVTALSEHFDAQHMVSTAGSGYTCGIMRRLALSGSSSGSSRCAGSAARARSAANEHHMHNTNSSEELEIHLVVHCLTLWS